MSVQIFHSILETRSALEQVRRRGDSIGFVPTMGALHTGHGCLIETARRETDFVVVSVFVNPPQFDREDDFARYPRDLKSDVSFCESRRVDLVFAPEAEEMYPSPQRTWIEVTGLTEQLCGRFRPGHFRGVATVVLKLLNIIQPDRAYFGEKDAQQLAVIQRLVRDLNVPSSIIAVPTVRDPDGLAVSSRNRRLSAEERQEATAIYRALCRARERIENGATNAGEIKREAQAMLEAHHRLRIEYLEIVDAGEMQSVEHITGPVRVAAAVWAGSTRLIDNLLCVPGTR